MGIYDRDYYREPTRRPSGGFGGGGGALGGIDFASVNTWLIAINVAVFLLNGLLVQQVVDADGDPIGRVQPLYTWGFFSVATALGHGEVWRFITFQFLHANFNHILFNMFSLYFFGQLIEQYLGSRRYLAFYLLCGVAGPVMYIALWAAHVLITSPYVPLVGASAGIFGVLIAAATVAPDSQVLVWGILPVRMRTFAWVLLAVAAFTVYRNGGNAGGQAAHLGGAAAGYALIRNPRLLAFADRLGPAQSRMRYRR